MKTAEHIIETVDKLVRKYHTRDPYELCQLLGIKIHYYDLQKKLKGFFYYQSRQKNIVIDHNVNGILERILVAHELGHAVLHTKIAMMHGFQEMEVFDDSGLSGIISYSSRILAICAWRLPAHRCFSLCCPAPRKYSQSIRRRSNS